MKTIFIIMLFSFLFGCVTSPTKMPRQESTFILNGEQISVSNKMLLELRERWKGRTSVIVANEILKESDIRWSLDYISLLETLYSKNCNSLHIIKTRQFDIEESQIQKISIVPGIFDYAWEVDVCGETHTYRVVNEKGKQSFRVYPTSL